MPATATAKKIGPTLADLSNAYRRCMVALAGDAGAGPECTAHSELAGTVQLNGIKCFVRVEILRGKDDHE